MLRNGKWWSAVLLVAGLGIGYLLSPGPRATAQGAASAGGPKYTVVHTDILSLLVVDNSSNTVFFYTTDKDAPPGSDLHLRGSMDLTAVGQPVLKPNAIKVDK